MEYRQYRQLQKCYPDGTPVDPPVYVKSETYEVKDFDTLEECESGIEISRYCIGFGKVEPMSASPRVVINGTEYRMTNGTYYNGVLTPNENTNNVMCVKMKDAITSLKFDASNLRFINLCGFDTSNVTSVEFVTGDVLNKIYCSPSQKTQLQDVVPASVKYWFDCPADISVNKQSFFWGKTAGGTAKISYSYKLEGQDEIFEGSASYTNANATIKIQTDYENITQMQFQGSYVYNLDLSNLNLSHLTTMERMFSGMGNLTLLGLPSSIDTTNVTNMENTFYSTSLKTIDLSNFNTSNVTIMRSTFAGNKFLETLNLSSFDTSKVVKMYSLFSGCTALKTLDLSNFDMTSVTSFDYMFRNCTSLKHIKCKQAFKDWCEINKNTINLDNFDTITWEIVG